MYLVRLYTAEEPHFDKVLYCHFYFVLWHLIYGCCMAHFMRKTVPHTQYTAAQTLADSVKCI